MISAYENLPLRVCRGIAHDAGDHVSCGLVTYVEVNNDVDGFLSHFCIIQQDCSRRQVVSHIHNIFCAKKYLQSDIMEMKGKNRMLSAGKEKRSLSMSQENQINPRGIQ